MACHTIVIIPLLAEVRRSSRWRFWLQCNSGIISIYCEIWVFRPRMLSILLLELYYGLHAACCLLQLPLM